MHDVLFDYEMSPTTWAYLSSLMTIGIYFKFRRFWSVRNLDLVALITFSPGLLLVLKYGVESEASDGRSLERLGYVWLFGVSAFFLIRLLLDSIMVRRPLLKPNLSAGGLTFTGAALLVFLMANVITGRLTEGDLAGARRAEQIRSLETVPPAKSDLSLHGPGYPLFYLFANFAYYPLGSDDVDAPEGTSQSDSVIEATTARTTAILAQLIVVLGMVLIGLRHFGNIETGVATASLYLLLPYTAQMTARVDHVVPAALLVWAVLAYRRPVVAGVLIGLAAGVIYYPLFLLPLWCGFYWRRGLFRFLIGVAAALVVMVGSLAFTSSDLAAFGAQLGQMFGWATLMPDKGELEGFWALFEQSFRIPVMAAFAAIAVGLALWPAQKNLGTLLSCSAAVMLGAQFWHTEQGGLCMAWYLPLLLLTIFRPNLEDRVAVSALAEFSIRRHKVHPPQPANTVPKSNDQDAPSQNGKNGQV